MEVTPQFIASLINGKVEGNADIPLTGFAKIEEATPGCISFIANPKYTHCIYDTMASAVLVSDEFSYEGNIKPTLIRVKDPYMALAQLLKAMQEEKQDKIGIEQPVFVSEDVQIPDNSYIGAFTYIGKNVRLGKGTKIYPQCYVGDNVSIGENTILMAGVRIYEGCIIGDRCILHSGAVIGADGFGFAPGQDGEYAKIAQIGNVVIGNNVEIGANTTVDRATFGSTKIGDGTKLDNLIQVAHNVEIGNNNVFAAQTGIAGSTKIGSYNQIGGQVGFAGHIKIGNYNEIGAQSGVPSSIGDKNRIIGYPAIDARAFFKMQVYLKRLDELFKKRQ